MLDIVGGNMIMYMQRVSYDTARDKGIASEFENDATNIRRESRRKHNNGCELGERKALPATVSCEQTNSNKGGGQIDG